MKSLARFLLYFPIAAITVLFGLIPCIIGLLLRLIYRAGIPPILFLLISFLVGSLSWLYLFRFTFGANSEGTLPFIIYLILFIGFTFFGDFLGQRIQSRQRKSESAKPA